MTDPADDGRRGRPVIVWRCQHRHELLKVFLSLDGWLLATDDQRERPNHAAVTPGRRRFPRESYLNSLSDRRTRIAPLTGRVVGESVLMPLDVASWDELVTYINGDGSVIGQHRAADVRLLLRCRCGREPVALDVDLLREDVGAVKRTRPPLSRTIML